MKRPLAATLAGLLGLAGLALAIRVAYPWEAVFGGASVQFQETDAWHHRRLIEFQVRNYPARMAFDPYGAHPQGQEIAVGPLFDFIAATIISITGAPLDEFAAFYPAVLGALCLIPVFLFHASQDRRAAWLAALTAAVMPGYFPLVSSLGFTDHHVLECLLSAALLASFAHPGRGILSGVILGAYALTWVCAAFVVAILLVWVALYAWLNRPAPELGAQAARAFGIAFLMAVPFFRIMWMEYTLGALGAGWVFAVLLARGRWDPRITILGAAATALAAAAVLLGGDFGRVLSRLAPESSTLVQELAPIFRVGSRFTLLPALGAYGPAFAAAFAGLPLLLRLGASPGAGRLTLLAVWTLVSFAASLLQLRMAAYFALPAALVTGWFLSRLAELAGRRARLVTIAGAAAICLTSLPFHAELLVPQRGPDQDWLAALSFLRDHTPEPEPSLYWKPAPPGARPANSYGVLAWWDAGYWITGIARRIPVTNPSHINAAESARLLLIHSEQEARDQLKRWGIRYIAVDRTLPMLVPPRGSEAIGRFPGIVQWSGYNPNLFAITLHGETAPGRYEPAAAYLPAYYQTLLFRLAVLRNAPLENPEPVVATWRIVNGIKVITSNVRFSNAAEAQRHRAKLNPELSGIVSDHPARSPVEIRPWPFLRQVFAEGSVAIFEVIP